MESQAPNLQWEYLWKIVQLMIPGVDFKAVPDLITSSFIFQKIICNCFFVFVNSNFLRNCLMFLSDFSSGFLDTLKNCILRFAPPFTLFTFSWYQLIKYLLTMYYHGQTVLGACNKQNNKDLCLDGFTPYSQRQFQFECPTQTFLLASRFINLGVYHEGY